MSGDRMTCEVRIDTPLDGSIQVLVTCRPLAPDVTPDELYRVEAKIARIMTDMLREVYRSLGGDYREERLALIYDHGGEVAQQ